MFLYFVLLFHCVFVFCFFVIHGADGECIVTTVVTKKKIALVDESLHFDQLELQLSNV